MKEMIKKYKGTLICSVLVMLAGILVGFTMAQSIWINVFFVVTDCILVTIIFYDNRNRQQSSKVIGMVIWMIPVTALIYNGMARLISMDADSENLFMAVIYFGTGLLFMIIGNYLSPDFFRFCVMLPNHLLHPHHIVQWKIMGGIRCLMYALRPFWRKHCCFGFVYCKHYGCCNCQHSLFLSFL